MNTEKPKLFIVEEQAAMRGYRETPKRFLFTMNAANRELLDGIAKELGIDAITFCRAAVQKVAAEYMLDKEPFIREIARVKRKIAERFALDARDADRRAWCVAKENSIGYDMPPSVDAVDCIESAIETESTEGK